MEVNLGGGEVGSWQRGSKSLAREEEAWSLIAARIAKKNLKKRKRKSQNQTSENQKNQSREEEAWSLIAAAAKIACKEKSQKNSKKTDKWNIDKFY